MKIAKCSIQTLVFNTKCSTRSIQREAFNAKHSTRSIQHEVFNTKYSKRSIQHEVFKAKHSTRSTQREAFNTKYSTQSIQHKVFTIFLRLRWKNHLHPERLYSLKNQALQFPSRSRHPVAAIALYNQDHSIFRFRLIPGNNLFLRCRYR